MQTIYIINNVMQLNYYEYKNENELESIDHIACINKIEKCLKSNQSMLNKH